MMLSLRHILTFLIIVLPGCLSSLGQGNYVREWVYLDSTGRDEAARIATVYYDGLGRQRLRVISEAGGAGDDLAVRTDYDARGNVERKWLPIPGGSEVWNTREFDKAIGQFYGQEEIAFSKYGYEEFSSLNRLDKIYGPGLLWNKRNKEKFLQKSWHKNDSVGIFSCVMLVAEDDGSVSARGLYGPNTLTVEMLTDPDGIRTLTFSNRAGNTVMVRRVGTDGTRADTRYVYDVYGDLRCTVSPEGARLLPSSKEKVDDEVLENFAARYEYDIWHRCISAKAPGCGAVQYVYNRMGAVCMESTASGRLRGEWTVTKYDSHRRPVVRGTVSLPGASRESLQQLYGDSLMEERLVPEENIAENMLLYSNDCGPQGFKPYMAWYYDNYDFILGPNQGIKGSFETAASDGYTQKTMLTGMAQVENGSGIVWYSAWKYDRQERPLLQCYWDFFLQSNRHTTSMLYDFTGNETVRREVNETMGETIPSVTHHATTRTFYDKQGRVVKRTVVIDDNPEVVLSEFTYDAIGRLATEKSGTLSTSLDYDIRSNVTGISSYRFSQRAWYGQTPTPGTEVSYGNINAQQSVWFDGADTSTKMETFSYDSLGRYLSSVSDDGTISERICVDLDANVTEINRLYNGESVQDAFIYYSGGKATEVSDVSTPYYQDEVGRFPTGEHELTYDVDGRLVSDGTRSVSDISYLPFGNLPRTIKMANGDKIYNSYLPDGTLMSRNFSTNVIKTSVKITADGDTIIKHVSRPVSAVHRYFGAFEQTPDEWLYHTSAGHYDLRAKAHCWYLRDRLGSTVAVVDSAGRMLQATAYYPSGTPHRLSNTAVATEVNAATDHLHIGNRYLSHSGLNLYDNTARMHDPLLMRFTSPDPLASKYPALSPWAHCATNPLNLVDPSGNTIVASKEAQEMFYNMLPNELKTNISFDEAGVLSVKDDAVAKNNSLVYKNLYEVATDTKIVDVSINDVFSYVNSDTGELTTTSFSENTTIDSEDPVDLITFHSQLGTGETGWYGTTIIPEGENKKSIDGISHVIMNPAFSLYGKSQGLGHELLGHIYIYFKTGDSSQMGHHSKKTGKENIQVNTLIIQIVNEIIKNQSQY